MEWKCSECSREIISKEKGKACLECWWKQSVNKAEVNSETIKDFMEKYWITILSFNKGGYSDILWIGVEDMKTLTSHRQKKELDTCYYPRTKRNMNRLGWSRDASLNTYTVFLEKLFHFCLEEKIKIIRGNWKAEKKSSNELSFKISDIIIEKKTAEEIEKEE